MSTPHPNTIASDDGWWDSYTYARALVVTERDPAGACRPGALI